MTTSAARESMSGAHAPDILAKLHGVSHDYSGQAVLEGIDLSIAGGRSHALVGENGAGKSTIVKILSGLVRPRTGELRFGERIVRLADRRARWDAREARRLGITCVYQELSLCPNRSVLANLALGSDVGRGHAFSNRKALWSAVLPIFERLGLALPPGVPVGELDLAHQTLLEIARAMLGRPRILLLDEATAALTHDRVERVFDAVAALREHGCAIVFISHRLPEVLRFSEQAVVLRGGRIIADTATAATDSDTLVEQMAGRSVDRVFPPKRQRSALLEPALELEGFGSRRGGTEVDLVVPRGSIVGLGGLQGQGQSEVLEAVFGIRHSSGTMRLFGRDVRPRSVRAAMQADLAYIPPDRKTTALITSRTVRENLTLPAVTRFTRAFTVRRDAEARAIRDSLATLSIKAPSPYAEIGLLSGGNQQKVAIARWLLREPRLLLVDDPTRGVDVATRADIYHLLRSLADSGLAVLMTSSDTLELVGLCNAIAVMAGGRIVKTLQDAEISEQDVVAAAVMVNDALDALTERAEREA